MLSSPLRALLLTAALLLTGVVPSSARAVLPSDSVAVQVETRYRWLHEEAHPGSVPFSAEGQSYDVVRHPFPGWGGYIELRSGSIEVRANWNGREPPTSLTVLELREAGAGWGGGQSVALQLSGHLQEQRPILYLPETIAWEMLIPAPAGLAPGFTWTDTLDFHSVPLDSVQEHFGGVWRYEVEGDTVLYERTLPRIRFEADVHVRRLRSLRDPARPSHLQLEREASGHMAGWFVLDTLTGARIEGVDSTRLEGTAALRGSHHPDLISDVIYEQHRRWVAVTPERERAWEAEWDRSNGGMLLAPEPPTEEPPSPEVVDSLWTELMASEDPERRSVLRGELLSHTGREWEEIEAEEATRLLALGDPIPALRALVHGSNELRLDSANWALYQPYLDDPERLWRLGLTPGDAWSGLADALLWSAPWSGDPESEWACRPDQCAAVVAGMEASPNPILRETALVGRFVQDPTAAAPPLEAAFAGGALHLGSAVAYARGIGAQWPAAAKTAMPASGADWREWLTWMGGEVRFEGSHRRALAVYEARAGRDPLAGLLDRWEDMEGDSARLVVGSLLRGAGRLESPSAEELVRDLLGDSQLLREAAQGELRSDRGTLETLSDAESVEFLAPLLDSMVVSGAPPWPSATEREGYAVGQGFHGLDEGTRYLLYQPDQREMIEAIAEARGLEALSQEEWDGMDRRSPAVGVVLERPSRRGTLVRLEWSWYAWAERDEDAVPRGYAGGGTLWLAPSGDGWVSVVDRRWIT